MIQLEQQSAAADMAALGRELAAQLNEHLVEHIMPFWCGPAVDQLHGGWMAWLTNDLTPDRTQPKGLIVHSRILWAFSAVHQVRPQPEYRRMAFRAFDYLMLRFWDAEHGGAFWRLKDQGEVWDDSKKTYGQAFCLYALTEFHRAFGSKQALDRAQDLFGWMEQHAHDPKYGGYLEVRARDGSPAGPDARLSEKDRAEQKSMNNHLHVLEAYTNLGRVIRSAAVVNRLQELIELFLRHILDARTGHLHHFFDEAWNVRSDTYTFGHDIEASWLLVEAAEVLGDATLLARVKATALQMAAMVQTEALSPEGGLYYEGRAGLVIDRGHECWPQAEAIVGFLNAFELSTDPKYQRAAIGVWHYARQNLVDRQHGEWFWRINEDGRPNQLLPKVSEWKGPYHVSRACLEAMRRVSELFPS